MSQSPDLQKPLSADTCPAEKTSARISNLTMLPQPSSRFTPTPLVKLCYTLVHAAEAAEIHDLADGEFLPADTSLERGIERQLL